VAKIKGFTVYLIVQHEQQRTLDILITGPFHLKPISLLRCRCAVPLYTTSITTQSAT